MMRKTRTGFTLTEVLLASALLIMAGAALLFATERTMTNAAYLSQTQVAMNAAQGQLESLAATSFDTLWTSPQFALARTPGRGQCIGEDVNCNGVLDPGEDLNGNGILDPGPFPNGQLVLQIRAADLRDALNPALLNIHIAACWGGPGRPETGFRGHPVGEDQNCNGVLDAVPILEDVNGNGWIDSPVMVSTRVGRQD